MIRRKLASELHQRLQQVPAVALLGPRQVGKTTLALARGGGHLCPLSRPRIRAGPREAHGAGTLPPESSRPPGDSRRGAPSPGLFTVLRGLIDRARRASRPHGHGLSPARLRFHRPAAAVRGVTGRADRYLELRPFSVLEDRAAVADDDRPTLAAWRLPREHPRARPITRAFVGGGNFIRTYLERDIPSSARESPPRRCAASGPCSPIIRADC